MVNSVTKLLGIAFMVATTSISGLAESAPQARKGTKLAKASADLVEASNKYKASLEALIPFHEKSLAAATEAVKTRQELYSKGIISKRDLEAGEQAVKDASTQLEQARQHIKESDQLIAEATAERAMPGSSKPGAYTVTSAIIRYTGLGGWALTNASKVQGFFTAKFGRSLPISAYGQTATHNRMGFDHRNSVDVAIHPDSAAGKALIAYLRGNGIPFLAFRSAIRGVATGAHVHIGYPSHKTS